MSLVLCRRIWTLFYRAAFDARKEESGSVPMNMDFFLFLFFLQSSFCVVFIEQLLMLAKMSLILC